MDLMSIVGLIVGVIGGALGAFSILVTWKLYQAGDQLNRQTLLLLADIRGSSHTAETTTTRFTERLVGALIELLNRDVRSSLAVGQTTLAERIDSVLVGALSTAEPQIAQKVRGRVRVELAKAFRSIEFQTASLARLPKSELAESSIGGSRVVAPGLPSLIKWIVKNEPKYSFFSVKFLREKLFAGDPVIQEALQFAIDEGVLETYNQPNPKNPAWVTKACRLKREHPTVCAILAEAGEIKTSDSA
jgi:hypothetical protein